MAEAHLLASLEKCEVEDAEVYVPFLLAYLEASTSRGGDREALQAIEQYLIDGIEDGICKATMHELVLTV